MGNQNKVTPGLGEFALGVIVMVIACLWIAAAIIVPAALVKLCWLFLLA